MLDTTTKIKSIEELAEIVNQVKTRGLRVAQCHGVFDLLHPGHIRHFEAAHRVADLVIVTVTPDEYVNKGPGRPVFNQRLRAESIAALEVVDYVSINQWPTAVEAIRNLQPDLYIKGGEYSRPEDDLTGKIVDEAEAVQAVGGEIYFTNDVVFSSTNLLNNFFSVFTPEADEYLRRFRKIYEADEVIEKLKSLSRLKVLILGDIIIDEYHYCKALGKSSKSSTLTARYLSAERHPGGALAVANHVAGFAGEVHLLTYIGGPEEDERFVKDHLNSSIKFHLIRDPDRSNIIKRRYVDPFQLSKMFEILWLNGDQPVSSAEDTLLAELVRLASQVDLVIVADFGHGNIGERTIDCLNQLPNYLCVNAQTNSANIGYNLITKYPRADYICLDEEEIRLANHLRSGDLSEIISQTAQRMECKTASVTRGSMGSLTWTSEGKSVATPVFSTNVVDSVGAGDAYLSVTSLCVRAGYDPDLIGFIGNCVGALAVRIVGNREPVQPVQLFKFIKTLLR